MSPTVTKTILGIDPGYGLCGYAVLRSGPTLVDYGVIKTEPGGTFGLRLKDIGEDFKSLLKTYKPDVVAIEDLFFVQNITTGLKVAAVRGVLQFIAAQHGVLVYEPRPTEIKAAFTGNGQAAKRDVQKMVELTFGHKPKVDDAADAIAVAWWAQNKLRYVV